MTLVNQSWLYKNDTRQYPLVDSAAGPTTGIVDASVSLSDSLVAQDARIYVMDIIVSPGLAAVNIGAEGFSGPDGSERIAVVSVEDPQAYRLYPLAGVVPGVYGYVVFGAACNSHVAPATATYSASTGALLESVVTRYSSATDSGFSVSDLALTGAVNFRGESGLVAEVVPVYFDDTKTTRLAMVLRLERNNSTMSGPVASCDMPAEVANRGDLCSSVNGITPDPNGLIHLHFWSTYDFKYNPPTPLLDQYGNPVYDSHGRPVYNPQAGVIWFNELGEPQYGPPYTDVAVDATGQPIIDVTKPVLKLLTGSGSDIVFEDFFDYRVLCSGKRKITEVPATITPNTCSNCTTQKEFSGAGLDMLDGLPVAMAGSAVWQDKLCLYWSFSPLGTPVAGNNPLQIQINMVEPFAEDSEGNVLPPLQVVGLSVIRGTPPALPGDLLPGEDRAITPGSLGSPVYSVYTMNRQAVEGEGFTIELLKASVLKSAPPLFPVNYPVYHSPAKKDSCTRYSRSPTSTPTGEFL
jgi:hypothetical protein